MRPFSSSPSVNSSRIASPVGDSASAACRWRSRSSNDLSRKSPRWPPESAGLSTAGKPTVSAAGAASRRARTAANRGCGTPPSRELPAHRDLVRHQVRGLRADPRAGRAPPRPRRRSEPPGRRTRSVRRRPRAGARPRSRPRRRRSRRPRPRRRAAARPRRGSGRRRRRAARAASRAGSRAAGGAPRRRRERSSLAGDATWQNRNATRFQRAISQPFRRREPGRDTPPAERPAHERFLRPAVDLRADRRRRKGQERALASSLRAVCTPPRPGRASRRAGTQRRVRTRDALVGPCGHTVIVRVAGEDTASTSETRATARLQTRLDRAVLPLDASAAGASVPGRLRLA